MDNYYTIPNTTTVGKTDCEIVKYDASVLDKYDGDFHLTKVKSVTGVLNPTKKFRIVVPDCIEVIDTDNCGIYFRMKDKKDS